MGPIFNGMTIASERNVWAAGQNALEYANKFPQSPPTTPPPPTPTPTPTPEDGECPDSCPDDKTPPASETTKEEEVVQNAIDELSKVAEEIKEAEEKVEEAKQDVEHSAKEIIDAHPTLKAALDAIGDGISAGKYLDAAEPLAEKFAEEGSLTAAGLTILFAVVLYLGDGALEGLGDKLSEEAKKGEEALLNYAIDYLKKNYVVADGPYPATVGHTIGHSTHDMEAMVAQMIIEYMGGDRMPNLASKEDQGQICSGSPNVYFGGQLVARVSDVVDCNFHCPSKIAQGSKTVFANGQPIARVGSKTTCNGVIKQGVMSIFIDKTFGGASLYVDQGFAPELLDLAALLSEMAPPQKLADDLGDSVTNSIENSIKDDINGDGSDKASS